MKQLELKLTEPTISELETHLYSVHQKQRVFEKQRLKAIKQWNVPDIDKYDSLIQDCREKGDAIINKIISLLKRKP